MSKTKVKTIYHITHVWADGNTSEYLLERNDDGFITLRDESWDNCISLPPSVWAVMIENIQRFLGEEQE